MRTEYCHELAVRLLTGCTATLAAKHDIGIHVVFSHSSEHYIRLYAQIAYGARKRMKASKTSGTFCTASTVSTEKPHITRLAICNVPECGSKMDYAGPLWLGDIFDADFIELMIKENKSVAFKNSARITKLLTLTKEEASAPMTYYVVDKLSGKLGLPSPSMQAFLNALRSSGFQAVQTHFNTRGVRTDARLADGNAESCQKSKIQLLSVFILATKV